MSRLRDTRIAIVLVVIALVAMIALSGCDQTATPDDGSTGESDAGATDGGDADDGTEGDTEGDTDAGTEAGSDADTDMASQGDMLIDELCTRCHGRVQVDTVTGRDRAGWEATIDRMIQNGAVVTEAQKEILLDHLEGQ